MVTVCAVAKEFLQFPLLLLPVHEEQGQCLTAIQPAGCPSRQGRRKEVGAQIEAISERTLQNSFGGVRRR